jgi:trehalose-phosphatase
LVVSALVPGTPLERAFAADMPRFDRVGRERRRPFAAVVLELDGVLARRTTLARSGRARSGGREHETERLVACQDTVAALRRWRRGELACAVICRGPDGHRMLRAAGVREVIDVVLDDRTAAELGLRDEAELLRAIVARVGVHPHDAVLLAASAHGVDAGRRAGMGLVVGVDRQGDGHGRTLADAGAEHVVHDTFSLRFPRRLSSALASRSALAAWRGARSIAVFLDYDGTLTPIVGDPTAAVLSPAMRATLEALSERWPVAILSGRDRDDVEARVGVPDVFYAGAHGLDIAGRGLRRVPPEAEQAIPEVERAHAWLRELVGGIPGVLLERKRFSLAVHHRNVADPDAVLGIERAVAAVHARTRLRCRVGKRVLELVPDVEWDKGRALRWMLDVMGMDPRSTFPIHVGDDETDEDAFAALAGTGAGIRVGSPVAASLADWHVRNPDEVGELLEWLEQLPPA